METEGGWVVRTVRTARTARIVVGCTIPLIDAVSTRWSRQFHTAARSMLIRDWEHQDIKRIPIRN